MGLRFRKSVKIAPGIKVNFGKKSTGVSIGGKGGGVTLNSKSGVHTRASVPGTGISYVSKVGGSKKKVSGAAARPVSGIKSGPVKLCPTPRKAWYIILAVLFVVSGIIYMAQSVSAGLITAFIGVIMLIFTAKSPKKIKIDIQAFNRQLQIFDESINLFMTTDVPATYWGRYADAERAAMAMADMTDAPLVHEEPPQVAVEMLQNDKTAATNAFLDRYAKSTREKAFQLTRGRKAKLESFKLMTNEYADKMSVDSLAHRDKLYQEMMGKIEGLETT